MLRKANILCWLVGHDRVATWAQGQAADFSPHWCVSGVLFQIGKTRPCLRAYKVLDSTHCQLVLGLDNQISTSYQSYLRCEAQPPHFKVLLSDYHTAFGKEKNPEVLQGCSVLAMIGVSQNPLSSEPQQKLTR